MIFLAPRVGGLRTVGKRGQIPHPSFPLSHAPAVSVRVLFSARSHTEGYNEYNERMSNQPFGIARQPVKRFASPACPGPALRASRPETPVKNHSLPLNGRATAPAGPFPTFLRQRYYTPKASTDARGKRGKIKIFSRGVREGGGVGKKCVSLWFRGFGVSGFHGFIQIGIGIGIAIGIGIDCLTASHPHTLTA